MKKDKVKVLMTLHGMWPIPINHHVSPIELEGGICLVNINESDISLFDEHGGFSINLHEKGDIKMSLPVRNHPLSKLPRMGMLFEIQEKKNGSFMFMPHQYVAVSMRPKTILRLYKTGEFITSLIINEIGYDICTPISDSPDLLHYEITSQGVEPMKNFYKYIFSKWRKSEEIFGNKKNSSTFEKLRLRLNNAIQFLDKSYFDEFSFGRTIGVRKAEAPRNDNYLRLIFCWMGIESLTCHESSNTIDQLKNHLPLFLTGYSTDQLSKFVDEYYEIRSAYIHADPTDMQRILNKDLNIVRDVLKLLILVYFMIASDEVVFDELGKQKDIDPIKGLTQMDLSKYFLEMRNSGADFESYSFQWKMTHRGNGSRAR